MNKALMGLGLAIAVLGAAYLMRDGGWSYFTFHHGPPAPGSSFHFRR